MPRRARIVAPGWPHHVTQRGNRGGQVFFTDDDYQSFLITLGEFSRKHGLKIWAYCLMTNHVHLIAIPDPASALALTIRAVHSIHAMQVNQNQGWTGHLWQGRYFSCVLDRLHLQEAIRYVERNPVRAGLVPSPTDYPWSSAQPHCALRDDPVLSYDLPLLAEVPDWREWLQTRESEAAAEELRRCTMRGAPCGEKEFVEEITEKWG